MDSLRACRPRRIVGLRMVLLAFAVVAGVGLALAFGLPEVAAKTRSYSAYDDPQKPALSFLLSDDRNVKAFQEEFGLDDNRVQKILAVIHREDRTLADEYEESEQIVESNEGASETEIKNKIAASDFDEKVKQAVARTKSDVEDLLPKGRVDDLGPWVDERWQAESTEYAAASEATYQASSRRVTCKVYASYYGGNTRYEVALPHKKVKFSGGRKVRIKNVSAGRRVRAPVREAGPWNIRDNYWRKSRYRSMWRSLPRCVPQAQAAFFDNFNRGEDQFGREVGNPAGIDITPAVARRMGVWRKLQRRGLIRVRVNFTWVSR